MSHPLLVTGAAGFVGARFVESCQKQGIPVISVDQRDYFADRPEHQNIDFGTIIDRDDVLSWLHEKNPPLSGIVHLGACARTTELDEAFLFRNNVQFSQHLWNHASAKKLPFVYASSAATYGDGALGYDDDESLFGQLKPLNPYGESKRLFDVWALEQEKTHHTPPSWCGLKFFNVYGFGERHKGSMASVILHAYDQILKTGGLKLFKSHKAGIADGHQERDFIYVDDVVKVLHFAWSKPISRGVYNLGTGQARTFLALAKATFKALSHEEKIDFIPTPEHLRDRYQYFTQAKMDRLRQQGFLGEFTSLEKGAELYIARLRAFIPNDRLQPKSVRRQPQ